MNFYQTLQLDPSILKRKIQNTEISKEKWFYRLTIVIRSILIVSFAILFISTLAHFFGSENTPMAVALFCILLGIRFVNFEYCIKDSLITLALSFTFLLVAPPIANTVPPIFSFFIHFICFFSILFMTCQRPELGNGGLYNFAYIYLSGNPVYGESLIHRATLTLVGYGICAFILLTKHSHVHPTKRFHHLIRNFSFQNTIYRWQLRLALGVSFILTIGSALQVERFMWMGFACASLLASYPYTNNETERFWHRLIGTVVGSSLFYLLTLILPTSLHSLLGPIGGFCLGFCTDYRYKTAINCFGALMIASSIYGIHGAVLLRIWDNFLGITFSLCFIFLYHYLFESKFSSKTKKEE